MLKELYFPRECYSQQKESPEVFYKKRFSLSKRYWTPEKACNFVFSTETHLKKYDFKINRKSRSKVMPVFVLFTVMSSSTNY